MIIKNLYYRAYHLTNRANTLFTSNTVYKKEHTAVLQFKVSSTAVRF